MIEIIQTILLGGIALYLFFEKSQKSFLKSRTRGMILDSSALIDGRIVDVVKAGFTPPKLIIPQFIVRELQLLADGNDSHKRERARFGLDVVKQLQAEFPDTTEICRSDFTDIRATDDKLVRLASDISADLCTTDYNLNKVATIEGVRVLNVNELANAVRPVALPGEKNETKIIQRGSSKDQGVGYLDDGTMVVVSGAGNMIGKTVGIEVTRMLQTEAGKMIFARRSEAHRPRQSSNRKNTTKS